MLDTVLLCLNVITIIADLAIIAVILRGWKQ